MTMGNRNDALEVTNPTELYAHPTALLNAYICGALAPWEEFLFMSNVCERAHERDQRTTRRVLARAEPVVSAFSEMIADSNEDLYWRDDHTPTCGEKNHKGCVLCDSDDLDY